MKRGGRKRGAYSTGRHAPELQSSVVAFLDVLGFADAIRTTDDAGRNALLARMSRFLRTWRRALSDEFSSDQRAWEVTLFSDNILVSHPIRRHGDPEMGSLFSQLSLLQLGGVSDGFFMRGGIAVGPMFVGQDVIFGFPLVEAYECERRAAKWPRIALGASARQFLLPRMGRERSIASSPYSSHVVQDAEDGQLFLNYMEACFQTSGEPPEFKWIEEHRAATADALGRFATEPRIGPKYAWLARYHNLWCSEQGLPEYRIPGHGNLSVSRLEALHGAESIQQADGGPYGGSSGAGS